MMLNDAMIYASLGWKIIPLHSTRGARCACGREDCASPGKHPRTAHGLKDATTDERQIQRWWKNNTNHNIGIITGATSGLVVIDIDGPAGASSWAELEDEHGHVVTLEQRTGRLDGGRQLIFAHPGGGLVIRNRTTLRPGLDVRGDGGYIVAPPSIHASGQRYSWASWPVEPAPCPPWLIDLMTAKDREPQQTGSARTARCSDGRGTVYGCAALEAECADVAATAPGERNARLNLAALKLGQLVAGGELVEVDVIEALLEAALRAGLGKAETVRTIRSGMDAGAREPRQAPPPSRSKDSPKAAAKTEYLRTDLGNSELFCDEHGTDLRYCYPREIWLAWTGTRWAMDGQPEVERRAAATARSMLSRAVATPEDEYKGSRIKHAIRTQSLGRRRAMVDGARHILAVGPENLDADPNLFNTANGTVDLKTGEIRTHRRDDLITRIAGSAFDANARCPRWLGFLSRIMADDEELIWFLQRAVGYSLTGEIGEQAFILLIGPTGANGKSTFLTVLTRLLGDYARVVGFKTLLADDKSRNKDPELAELNGPRFVTAAEPDPGSRFDEGLIKRLTGCEEITAARKYEHPITFRPVAKLWLGCNSPPRMRRGGEAMKRRLLCLPFDVQIPEAERDRGLEDKLVAEGPGILAWAVRGCLDWRDNGLRAPKRVIETRDSYLDEQDPLVEWMGERTRNSGKVLLRVAYNDYSEWCQSRGCSAVRDRTFAELLRERGFEIRKSHGSRWLHRLELGTTDHTTGDHGSPGQRGLYD